MSDFIELQNKTDHTNRRWFMSNELDLILFFDENGAIREFQLCYDKNKHEQMLSWNVESGYTHMAIDDCDELHTMGHKKTPLIVPNGSYSLPAILQKLLYSSGSLPDDVLAFVQSKIEMHPEYE